LADGTPIYRSGNVSDEEMATAVANAQTAYVNLDMPGKDNWANKVDAIHITPTTSGASAGKIIAGKKILEIRHNRNESQIQGYFEAIGDREFIVVQVRMDNAIRIARVMTFDANAFAKKAVASLTQSKRALQQRAILDKYIRQA
jgi:hypothetical protein